MSDTEALCEYLENQATYLETTFGEGHVSQSDVRSLRRAATELRRLRDLIECELCRDSGFCSAHQSLPAAHVALLTRADTAEKERDEAKKNYQFILDKDAKENLPGYQELGQAAAKAESLAFKLSIRIVALEKALREVIEYHESFGNVKRAKAIKDLLDATDKEDS